MRTRILSLAELLNKKAKELDPDDETKNERELFKGELKKEIRQQTKLWIKSKLKNPLLVGQKTKVWIPEGAVYAIATNMAKKKKQTPPSIDMSSV